jgi:hypothetical protein
MSDVPLQVVIAAFKDENTANEALKALKQARNQGLIRIVDAAVLRKDEKGKLHIKETADMGGGKGAVIGGVAGGVIGLLAGPVGWAALGGAVLGGLAAKMKDGGFVISHIMRGQWGALERETKIETLARADAAMWKSYEVVVEQEPGPIWEDEPVQMADGSSRPLKSVAVGDEVIGQSGSVGRVIAAVDKGPLEALRIETASGRVVHAALDVR